MDPERLTRVGAVDICLQTSGRPQDPAILLIHGACASMVWWDEELCDRLAATGRFVIRYDQRDTGRSSTFPVGRPGYAMSDLAKDAVGVLDAVGVQRAHVVGRSMSGGVALVLGVDHPSRVASLTFMSTTTADDGLPPPTEEYVAATSGPAPDVADRAATADHLARQILACYSAPTPAEERAVRATAALDVARTRDLAAMGNHFAMSFDGPTHGGFADLTVPCLVVHGELDPMLPLPHGEAVHAAIPGSDLVVLRGAGHELPRSQWDRFVDVLARHTAEPVSAG